MSATLDATPSPPSAGTPAPPTSPTQNSVPQPQLPASITQAIQNTVTAAPELANQPGAAVSVAAAGGSPIKAQAVAQAGKRQAIATAHESFWSTVTGDAGKALHGLGQAANAGLATVQQEYRYLHDVEARHGLSAAMGEGLGILVGAAGGTLLDPGEGTVIGAELAARIEGATLYKDSWARAANPNYRDPHTGQLVSFGRDVASAVGLQGGEKTVLSGALDGLGDLVADPVALAGKAVTGAHSIEGMGGLAGKVFTGTGMTTPEQVDRAWSTLPSYRRAVSQIAEMGPTEVAVRFPQFKSIAQTLGDANSAQDVHEVFHDLAKSYEFLDANKLPTMSLTRTATGKFHELARNAGEGPISNVGGPVGMIGRAVANNPLIGPRRWADRLEALPGTTFDPVSMDFSGTQISLANTRGIRDIYALVRFGNSDRVAKAVGDAWVGATVAQRKVILRNAVFDTVANMAKMKVPEGVSTENYLSELGKGDVVKAIKERFDNHLDASNIEGVNPERQYGIDNMGNTIQGVQLPDGTVQAGITRNQTGDVSLPNIVEARRMAQAIRSTRTHRVLAGLDDWTYDHVTQGFFKPMVLMSGGYGFHISLAEAIPNALRHGIVATTQGLYDRALVNLGYKADKTGEGDVSGLAGLMWKVGGGHLFMNNDRAQHLAEFYAMNEGYRRPVGMAAGQITSGETQPVLRAEEGLRQVNATPMHATDEWTKYGNESAQFIPSWQAWLRQNSNDQWTQHGARAYLQAIKDGKTQVAATEEARQAVVPILRRMPQPVKDDFVRSTGKKPGAPESWDPIDDWAHSIVENMKGSVHARPGADGKPGAPNLDLLHSLANGHTPTAPDLEKIDAGQRPLFVPGRVLVPRPKGTIQQIANFGFKKVLDPMVNMVSRNQEFAVEFSQAREALQPKVDAGILAEDEALIEASQVATVHSMRFIHNLDDRTQWTTTMRNWAPFFFAQEQAYRRMGRLLAEDPGGFRRYQMMISGVSNMTAQMQDSNGNKYIAFPGSGFAGKGLADAMGLHGLTLGSVSPAAYGGSFSSANVIFPLSQGFKPDLGPVAILPLAGAASLMAEMGHTYSSFAPVASVASQDLQWVTGSQAMSTPLWEQLIPNAFLAHLVDTFSNGRAFQSSLMQAYQFADYQQAQAMDAWQKGGEKGPAPQLIPAPNASPAEAQAFKNKIVNWTRALYLGRAISAMISPVSSNVEMQNFGFPAKLQTEITKAGSVNLGMQNFILHNPNAVPYTVSQSYVPDASGTPTKIPLPSSQVGQTWVEQHQPLLSKYGVAALWLMPQLSDTKYSPAVYNEQIAQGLRVKDTPQEFLNALYTAAGDSQYYAGLTIHESALQAAGKNSAAVNTEYNAWNAWVAQLQKQNPVWAEQHFSANRQTTSQQSIQQLTKMFNDNAAPPGQQTDLVKGLLENYNQAATDYATAGNQSSYSTQLSDQKKVNDAWIQYLDQQEIDTPALKPVIQAVFKTALKVTT